GGERRGGAGLRGRAAAGRVPLPRLPRRGDRRSGHALGAGPRGGVRRTRGGAPDPSAERARAGVHRGGRGDRGRGAAPVPRCVRGLPQPGLPVRPVGGGPPVRRCRPVRRWRITEYPAVVPEGWSSPETVRLMTLKAGSVEFE